MFYPTKVHLTGGSLRVFKQFAWLGVGSGKAALSRPAHQYPFGPERKLLGSDLSPPAIPALVRVAILKQILSVLCIHEDKSDERTRETAHLLRCVFRD